MSDSPNAPRIEPVFNPGDIVKLYRPGHPQNGNLLTVAKGGEGAKQIDVEAEDGLALTFGIAELTLVERGAASRQPSPAAPKRAGRGGWPKGKPRSPKARAAAERLATELRDESAADRDTAPATLGGEPFPESGSMRFVAHIDPPLTDRELLCLIELAETTRIAEIRRAALVILGRATA